MKLWFNSILFCFIYYHLIYAHAFIFYSTPNEQEHHKDMFNKILDYDQNLKRVLFVEKSNLGMEIFAHVSPD